MKRFSLSAALVAVVILTLPIKAATENTNETYRQLDLFGLVFEQVRSKYVEKVGDKKLIEAAVNGMLRSLDPHSSYMNAESFREMQVQTRGEFGGLGIEVTMDKGVVKVVSPIDDTPAHKAGVQSGDLITHIDGKRVFGMSLRDAVKQMRGPVGSKIRITIRRGTQKAFDVTIIRAVIKIRSVRSRLEGNIIYVRITTFSELATSGLRRAMAKHKAELGDKWQGVVLDLRNNPGGLLDQAVSVSDAFLDKGEIVSTRGRQKGRGSRFNAKPGDLAAGKPVVVLINSGSASASEIVAGALQDHRRAIIMGTKSFGKGSVQTIIPLGGRGAMRLTTARYYTPSGRSIQAKGVVPDIVVEQAKVEIVKPAIRQREADLRGALDTTKKKPAKKDGAKPGDPAKGAKDGKNAAAAKDAKKKPLDFQLARALDLLRGVALFNTRTSN